MRGHASAYAALELEPGADRAAVEAAYRRLIKLHHPDRSGGDASRAAEINRAYFELRSQPEADPAPVRPARSRSRRKQRPRSRRWPLLALVLLVLVLTQSRPLLQQAPYWVDRIAEASALVPSPSRPRSSAAKPSFDTPLSDQAVAASLADAVRLVRSGDRGAAVQHSRECHRTLRTSPELALLDRCAAFDSAVAALEDRDPSRHDGRFNASSVTARQMTAASLLSDDYLAIERRLNRIRNRVEQELMPPAPPPMVTANLPEELEAAPVEPSPDEVVEP